ncbi:RHS repeat-associated core domain-containing protein, partial [Denitromonas sp.]|uniref:RHS repeat-associated core domain-containing protein n=1 Tax=Denitromonas sp. TaxID=2734609 RepID=UPI003A891AF9
SYAGKTFTHGADGRLRTSTTGAGTVTYQYDGLGRRVSKSGPTTLVPGGFVRYAYDAAHHLVGEYQADGSPIKEYLWLGDLPVAVIHTNPDNTTTAYALDTDHLGPPRLLTDATRTPRWRWTSPPFGEVLPEDDPSGLGAVTFNLRFPGQYYDKETGLHYNFNRYYDPGTGRYVQSDPIGLDGGWNTYGYVGGNPLSYSDPLGLMNVKPGSELAPGGFVGGGLGGGGVGGGGYFSGGGGARGAAGGSRGIGSGMGPRIIGGAAGAAAVGSGSRSGSSQAECEADCDEVYDSGAAQCEAWWKTTGRNPGAYRVCMERVRANYIQCIQDCKDCEE